MHDETCPLCSLVHPKPLCHCSLFGPACLTKLFGGRPALFTAVEFLQTEVGNLAKSQVATNARCFPQNLLDQLHHLQDMGLNVSFDLDLWLLKSSGPESRPTMPKYNT